MSSAAHNLRVELGERSYDIIIGNGLLAQAAHHITPHLREKRVIIITDEQVGKLHLSTLTASLDNSGINRHTITLPAGEQTKQFSMLENLMSQLLDTRPERSTMLIALGGGVIGDITGFAASILLRGVPFIQIPTTLLAQVDSSVGGKTGINTKQGKNLVGSFYQPKLVLADVGVLTTLPQRERFAGYAEIVKYGLINDAAFFGWLEQNAAAMLKGDSSLLAEAVRYSCAAKAAIVSQDEKESGARALLNLGHTFGHALEAETGFSNKLLHGEAVAVGCVMAFALSASLGLCSENDFARVKAHFAAAGMPSVPTDIRPDWSVAALMHHFYQDKKVQSGKLTFILARGIGQSFIAHDIAEADITRALTHYFNIT